MPTKRFEKLDNDTQRRVLEAAAEEFAQHGYQAASLNQILVAAGMSKGSFYYYFENKADLYLSVLRDITQTVLATMDYSPDQAFHGDYWDLHEEFARRKVAFTFAHPRLARLLVEFIRIARRPDAPTPLKDYFEETRRITTEFYRKGQDLGVVRRDLPLDLLINLVYAIGDTLSEGLATQIEALSREEIDHHSRLVVDLVRRVAENVP